MLTNAIRNLKDLTNVTDLNNYGRLFKLAKIALVTWTIAGALLTIWAVSMVLPILRKQLLFSYSMAQHVHVALLQNDTVREHFMFFGEEGAGDDGQYTPEELREIIPFRVICSNEIDDGYYEIFVEPFDEDRCLTFMK